MKRIGGAELGAGLLFLNFQLIRTLPYGNAASIGFEMQLGTTADRAGDDRAPMILFDGQRRAKLVMGFAPAGA